MRSPVSLEEAGTFGIGCNYWASHVGTGMWSDWRPDIVSENLRGLAAHGVEWLRIFILWPDFQPISQLRTQDGRPVEMRFGEQPLPLDPVGQAGVSAEMLGRLEQFCALAEQHGMKLVVGLVTGWMSGRLFTPSGLSGLNPIMDPVSIAWQVKLVHTVVTFARDQNAIVAWDLGNECNCMGVADSREAAYVWTTVIANTIRAADPSRPVVSGMHSLSNAKSSVRNSWLIEDQGALTDILTTHPYPYWTRHTRADEVNSLRTTLHATAESRLYSDIGGKPCIAEEIGTMGPMIASDLASAQFARVNLFSLWANDCRAFMWWCAHDQTELTDAPYDWIGVESELGLMRNDGSAKPVLLEMGAFRDFLKALPISTLPPRRIDAVCLITLQQDDWAAAFGTYVLSKQAKLEIQFRQIEQEIPSAELYLLPSIQGPACLPRRQWLELLGRVRAGATLYVSLGDGIIPHFNETAGVELISRRQARTPLEGLLGEHRLPLLGADDMIFQAHGAEVLATRTDTGTPIFWKHRLGQGWVLVHAAPLEIALTLQAGAFDEGAPPYWRIYAEIAKTRPTRRVLSVETPAIAITEHPWTEGRTIIVAINHTGLPQEITAAVAPTSALLQTWRGKVQEGTASDLHLQLPAFDSAVFLVGPR